MRHEIHKLPTHSAAPSSHHVLLSFARARIHYYSLVFAFTAFTLSLISGCFRLSGEGR